MQATGPYCEPDEFISRPPFIYDPFIIILPYTPKTRKRYRTKLPN